MIRIDLGKTIASLNKRIHFKHANINISGQKTTANKLHGFYTSCEKVLTTVDLEIVNDLEVPTY